MKKLLSTMTHGQFNDYFAALGLTTAQLANKLARTPGMVSRYRSGASPIPIEVHDAMRKLMHARAAHIGRQALDLDRDHDAIVGAARVFYNTYEKRDRPPSFMNRVSNPKQRDYEERLILGAYRITMPRLAILRQGLVLLHTKLKDGLKAAPESKSLATALIDWRSVAERVYGLDKVTPPFTMRPSYADWRILSAAIRLVPGDEAYAFYQHWRRHKGRGWPYRTESLQPKE